MKNRRSLLGPKSAGGNAYTIKEVNLNVGDTWVCADGNIRKIIRIFTSTLVVQKYDGVTGKADPKTSSVSKIDFVNGVKTRSYKTYAGTPNLIEYTNEDQKSKMEKMSVVNSSSRAIKKPR